jgi:putative transposase
MTFYLAAGQGAATDPAGVGAHLPTTRARRYPSDTSDKEWQLIAAHLPAGGRAGRPVRYPRRDIVDAIRYLDHNSCVWRALPVDFPPWRLVYHYFRAWIRDGTLARLHNSLREQVRQVQGRRATPTAAIVDSPSVRAAETVARTSRGYDAGKKVNGRKRHIAVDTCGLLLVVLVTAGAVQDRDAARLLLTGLRTCFPTVVRVWADGAYTGHLVSFPAGTAGQNGVVQDGPGWTNRAAATRRTRHPPGPVALVARAPTRCSARHRRPVPVPSDRIHALAGWACLQARAASPCVGDDGVTPKVSSRSRVSRTRYASGRGWVSRMWQSACAALARQSIRPWIPPESRNLTPARCISILAGWWCWRASVTAACS